MVDFTTPKGQWVEARLKQDLILWLATAGPDGMPHNVPVWFWWDGAAFTIFSQPENKKIRNLRHQPAVSLALDTRDDGEEIVLFEGISEFLPEPTREIPFANYAEKYAHLFPRIDLTPETYVEKYTLAIRITPTKLMAWRDEG
jgi:PPOX class probable F420-dependent enzyme